MKQVCVGRDLLIDELFSKAFEFQSVLVFGGRQSGKTTLLKHAQELSIDNLNNASEFERSLIAIYVDLMSLPYDAEPSAFYGKLVECAYASLSRLQGRRVRIRKPSRDRHGRHTVDTFSSDITQLLRSRNQISLLLFLLDEGARVLGTRFPRAFQDNIFSMLYGGDKTQIADRVAFAFAGSQELLEFCVDTTSPIGSRAGQIHIRNLDIESVGELMRAYCRNFRNLNAADLTNHVYLESGGHAGLASRLARFCSDAPGLPTLEQLKLILARIDNRPLFELWGVKLSRGARLVLRSMKSGDCHQWSREDIAQECMRAGVDQFTTHRVWEELQYIGICNRSANGKDLYKCNEMFWRFYETVPDANAESSDDAQIQRVWDHIRLAETSLRDLVFREYQKKWGSRAQAKMRKMLGDVQWERIEEIHANGKKKYPWSPAYEKSIMDCMYFGQLGQLVENNQAWGLFKAWFQEKSLIQRWFREINVVRNDIAHFASDVPHKELERCYIACDDFMILIDQALQ